MLLKMSGLIRLTSPNDRKPRSDLAVIEPTNSVTNARFKTSNIGFIQLALMVYLNTGSNMFSCKKKKSCKSKIFFKFMGQQTLSEVNECAINFQLTILLFHQA